MEKEKTGWQKYNEEVKKADSKLLFTYEELQDFAKKNKKLDYVYYFLMGGALGFIISFLVMAYRHTL